MQEQVREPQLQFLYQQTWHKRPRLRWLHASEFVCAIQPAKNRGSRGNMSHPRQLQTYSWSSRITSCGLVVEYWCCSQNLYRFLRWHNHCEVCQSPQLLKCRSTATWRDFGGDEMDCWFEMSLVLKSLNSGKWEGTDFWQLKLSKTHWVFLFWVKNLY